MESRYGESWVENSFTTEALEGRHLRKEITGAVGTGIGGV